jgi:ribose transport system substrate-binding protein
MWWIALFAGVCLLIVGAREWIHARALRTSGIVFAIPRDTSASSSICEHAGLAQDARLRNLHVHWNGPRGGDDTEQQIRIVEQAIRAHAAGIVVTPNAPFVLDTVLHQALQRHIPVVIFGAPLSIGDSPGLSFVLEDVDRTGILAAERVATLIHRGDEVAVVGLDPSVPGTVALSHAFDRAIGGMHGKIDHVAGSQRPGQAEVLLRETLRLHPRVRAIYALNIQSTRGSLNLMQTLPADERIPIVGTDHALAMFHLLRSGALDALVIQDTRAMGAEAIEQIVATREGRSRNRIAMFPPYLLTRENIDSDAMQQRLLMDWRQSP